ncbi:hypothetical protein ACFSO7_02195 [Bacillus sp. CGMCC 1.16607]|uniref:hypothetical protein n=1 Tax=Bacillus sp. CGMCC 1.16607 TaxID=3351842 RepID=UPI0036386D0A
MKIALGTLKGKIVVGAVAFGLVSGVGTAFANTDAGGQLQSWYNNQFNAATGKSATELTKYGVGLAKGLEAEKNKLKGDTVQNVKTAGTDEVTRANGAINTAAQGHIDAINTKKGAISSGMSNQFDQFVNKTNGVTNSVVTSVAKKAQTEIENAVKAQGSTSLTFVNDQVSATKNAAIESLGQAIKDAKSELEGLLAAEQTAATNEMKANLDAQISAKRTQITESIAALELLKKGEITQKGASIEAAAKAELDALVSGINK